MAQAPNTNSTLTLDSGINKTSTAVSTNIIILVNNTPVGAVQSLAISEKRTITTIDEVGTDGHIDSVPTKSTDVTGSCDRVRFDGMRIAEAFSRGFLHAQSQVYPFDIVILDKWRRNASSQISTVIKNVWISGIDYTYNHDNWIITDRMTWVGETIFSVLNGGTSVQGGSGAPAATGGVLGIKHMGSGPNGVLNIQSGDGIVNIEQLADTGAGGRRGSLDAAGLIDIADSGSLF